MYRINYFDDILPVLKRAGEKINRSCCFDRVIESKGYANYVTDLDKTIERQIIDEILAMYPQALFISEEKTDSITSDSCWILDPIDGTTNLIHGYPSVAISLAHVVNGETLFGAVYSVKTQELFYAEKGKGAFILKEKKNKKISVSSCSTIEKSLIGFGCPYDKKKIDRLFSILKPLLTKCDDLKRSGPASVDICYVACGRLDGYLEIDLEAWDYAAGALILKEAGGMLTDFDNNSHPKGKSNVLATNGYMHKKILKELNNI